MHCPTLATIDDSALWTHHYRKMVFFFEKIEFSKLFFVFCQSLSMNFPEICSAITPLYCGVMSKISAQSAQQLSRYGQNRNVAHRWPMPTGGYISAKALSASNFITVRFVSSRGIVCTFYFCILVHLKQKNRKTKFDVY